MDAEHPGSGPAASVCERRRRRGYPLQLARFIALCPAPLMASLLISSEVVGRMLSEESEANQPDSVSGDTCSHAENSLRSVSAQVWIWPSPVSVCGSCGGV